jgi:hypothetical protein
MAKKPTGNVVGRGYRESTPWGTSLFVGLRAIDPLIQRYLLLSAPLVPLFRQLGYAAPPPPPAGGALVTTLGLNLTPFQTVIWAMSIGSAGRQIFWMLDTSREPMYPRSAIAISLFNTINNAINTVLFTIAANNPTYVSPWSMYLGAALYTIGIFVEPIAETQRRIFKDDPANKGKPYGRGLFGLARNINHGAYTFWRAGFALAAGGYLWGAFVASFVFWDFSVRGIPV